MAVNPTVLTDCVILINAVTISDHANKVELPISVDDEETTTFGQTYKTRVGGLKDAVLNATFINDFAQTQLDQIMFGLLGTVVTFEVRATSGSRSVSNPSYTGSILINSWDPLNGDVGTVSTVDVSFPTSGSITRATS